MADAGGHGRRDPGGEPRIDDRHRHRAADGGGQQALGELHPGAVRGRVGLQLAFQQLRLLGEGAARMPFAHHALLHQLEHAVEQRLGEMLAPRPGMAQGLGQVEVELLYRQAAVGQQPAGQVFFTQLTPHFFVEGLGECREVAFWQRQTGSHGVAAELADQLRVARGHGIQRLGRHYTVDQPALAEALRTGKIASAYLDVTEPEPLPPEHELWTTPNCYITPHTAGGRHDQDETIVRHFLANLAAFENGGTMTDRVV